MRNVLLVAAMLIGSTAAVSANCGIPPIPPIPPIGCSSMAPICMCNQSGQCWWTFQCIRSY